MANNLRASKEHKTIAEWHHSKSNILKKVLAVALCALLGLPLAQATVIDFDSLADGDSVTNQFADVTFQNTLVLTAGVSLNEFDFPPKSGLNVVSDDGGLIIISFINPMASVSGFFTYTTGLSFLAFDSIGTQIAAASSAFSSNLLLSGDVGSTPNEFLQVTSSSGITSVSISGDPAGGSFTLDDLTFRQASLNPVSEPATFALLPIGLAAIGLRRRRRPIPLAREPSTSASL
jgi:hypothetical protein